MTGSDRKESLTQEINGNENGLDGLSEKQYSQFLQFKEMVNDVIKPGYERHKDDQLVKFCIARKWDLKKAEQMFRDAVEFREKMRLDHILEEYQPSEMVLKYVTGGLGCVDREGCPVRFERFGLLDTKGIYYAIRRAELEKFKMYEQEMAEEMMREQSEKLGRKIDKLTVVMDLDQINRKQLWRPGLELYLHLVKLLEDNYPEMVKHLIVVNAPRIFPLFFKVCRPLISEDMRKKLQVYGTEFREELLKVISDEELPAFLGGKQTGPGGDVYCEHKIRSGGPVPESCYLKDIVSTEDMEMVNISPGNKLILRVPIDQPYCILSWEFLTKDKDIEFGLSFIPDGSTKQEVLIPSKRYQCHMVPEDGFYTCDKVGTYVVKFSNSYSWTKGKKLMYRIEALIEDEEILDEVKEVTSSGAKFG